MVAGCALRLGGEHGPEIFAELWDFL